MREMITIPESLSNIPWPPYWILLFDRKSTKISTGLIEMTIADKPNSKLQKYRLTNKGIGFIKF